MNTSTSIGISTLLCLPAPDVNALGVGRSICAITALFLRPGQKFLLCPMETLDSADHLECCYRPTFCPDARVSMDALECDLPEISYWATCEQSLIMDTHDQMEALAALSIWQKDWLVAKLESSKSVFVTILRVHQLVNSFSLPAEIAYQGKMGRFQSLLESHEQMESFTVLPDFLFTQRKQQLKKLEPPKYPELEILQSQANQLALNQPNVEQFNSDLRIFLGWQESIKLLPPSQDWFNKISLYGYRKDENNDDQKSNYQAGTDFEIIIRQSLEFLGFTVDESHAGGAGGIDVFCSQPYNLVGECKCGQGIPDTTVEQLARIAKRHLEEKYESAYRFIIGPGKASPNLLKSAALSRIAIMKPETLQKLVEFRHRYPISLLELRDKCLIAGQVDDKVDEFLEELALRVRLRSHIVTTLKEYLQVRDLKEIGLERYCGVFDASNPPQYLKERELHEILIELSSPLTGYLGRNKGETWKDDRFYFLRELPTP